MGKVYVVHCVDTEGPLNESLAATFQRIYDFSGIRIAPSIENLSRIQNKSINLNGYEEALSMAFSKRILEYKKNWGELDEMLGQITSDNFRKQFIDSYGNGWQYTWFILDIVDYEYNPRDRVMGYNAIWDHYMEFYNINRINLDEFQWHAHPMSTYKEANRSGTSLINSPHIYQSLAHRLIDRGFFPEGYRAGFHMERADLHWLLEQYIPYDFSNQSMEESETDKSQKDMGGSRFGDWRRALSNWSWYHPSHDDYQSIGDCHRYIFRCLNIGTRLRLITQDEVDKAFERAEKEDIDIMLAFCDHDFRNMKYDVKEIYELIVNAAKKYPHVLWENSTAVSAAKKIIGEKCSEMDLNVRINNIEDRILVNIDTNIDSFGSQPFFAVKMRGGEYRVDNLDIELPNRSWSYTFDYDTIHPEDVELIGVATNSREGSGALKVINMDNKIMHSKKW